MDDNRKTIIPIIPFSQKNDIYSRSYWDPKVKSKKAHSWFLSMLGYRPKIKKRKGYGQVDFALRNAAWSLSNFVYKTSFDQNGKNEGFNALLTPWGVKSNKPYIAPKNELTKICKDACYTFGASAVGVAKINYNYHYSHRFDSSDCTEKPAESLDGLTHCIVIGLEMPYDIIDEYPSAYAGIGPGYGYSQSILLLQTITSFIRQLGYNATASLNDTAQGIPYAIDAGLGEYGRNGVLINEKFGTRLRLGKIFTDMPLIIDKSVKFGVEELCNVCRKCTESCPPKAIPNGEPSYEIHNISNIQGIKKWTIDAEKCFSFWAAQGTECGLCLKVCPFNKKDPDNMIQLYKTIVFEILLKLKWYRMLLLLKS